MQAPGPLTCVRQGRPGPLPTASGEHPRSMPSMARLWQVFKMPVSAKEYRRQLDTVERFAVESLDSFNSVTLTDPDGHETDAKNQI